MNFYALIPKRPLVKFCGKYESISGFNPDKIERLESIVREILAVNPAVSEDEDLKKKFEGILMKCVIYRNSDNDIDVAIKNGYYIDDAPISPECVGSMKVKIIKLQDGDDNAST